MNQANVIRTYLPEARVSARLGYALSTVAVMFLLMDAVMKVALAPAAVAATTQLGYTRDVILPLGILQLICLALYVVPRTAVMGAVLWTGYLGGAIATHVRLDSPLLSHTLFPLYVALFLWGGLWLRNARLRALFPLAAR